jgi:hypothetical protein
MWSDLKKDFVWVSGVWRDIPPGRRWVPGHWTNEAAGFQWVPGFWAGEQVQEVDLLPTPPDTLEAGPTSPAPGDNYFWVPGTWIWQTGDYVWRPGYWYVGQQNWVWVPDHYCYTGGGAYFVNGYWDYPLASRGLLYAPVYWSRPIYNNAGWYYRPRSVIDTALLLTALYVNPYHSHYYYGYGGWGNNWYRPWWAWGWGRGHVYDPFYSYHRWHDGHNHHDWHDHVRRDWDRHHHDWDRGDWDHGDWNRGDRDGDRDGRGPRPGDFAGAGGVDGLVKNIDQLRQARPDSVRLQDLNQKQVQAAIDRSKNWQQIRQARVEAESTARTGGEVRLGDARRGGNRGPAGGDTTGQVGSTGPDGGRRLRVGADGAARSSFRLPPVDRSGSGVARTGVDAGGQARVNVPGNQGNLADRVRRGDLSQDASRALRSSDVNRDAINRRFNLPSGGQDNAQIGQGNRQTLPGNVRTPRGDAGPRRIEVPQDRNVTVPGRSFRYNGGGQANVQLPSGVQQRSLRVPTDGGSSVRVPSGGQPRNFSVPSGGGQPRSIQIPSGGGRSFTVPQGGGQSRSIRVPSSGGGGRSFSVPSGGGGQRSFSAPSGSSFRGFSGGGGGGGRGGANFRRGGGGGGGQQMFRGGGGGGGGGNARSGGGGGGGNRGAGGGGGGGRGRGGR